MSAKRIVTITPVLILLVTSALASEFVPPREVLPEETSNYSPYADRKATDRSLSEGLYWGDTHLHPRRTGGRLPIRTRGDRHEFDRAADEADPAARLSCGCRSCPELGPRTDVGGGQSDRPRHRDRQTLV